MKSILTVFVFLVLFCCCTRSSAQVNNLPIVHDTIYSKILNEKRAIEIVLPNSYKAGSGKTYDALYVTDGEWNTLIVSDLHQMVGIQFIPENIIVSVPNVYIKGANMRERDLTPTHIKEADVSGGGVKYLAFFKDELMPYIKKKYPVNGNNTYYGSSLAGLFGTYVFLTEPQLFQSYLLADPAFWWDNGFLFKLAKEKLGKMKIRQTSVYFTGRYGAPMQFMGTSKMDSIFRSIHQDSLNWKSEAYQGETHNAMIFLTVYKGLKFTYEGFSHDSLNFFPLKGIVLKGKPFAIHSDGELLSNIHYTINGSLPDSHSAKESGDSIQLNGPARLRMKALSARDFYSQEFSADFKEGKPFKAGLKSAGLQNGGLHYDYYEGDWDKLPEFSKLKPLKSGLAGADFNLADLPKKEHFALLEQGELEIKTPGYYVFIMDLQGGARLSVGEKVLINYDGIHKSGRYQSFILPLEKGFYKLKIEYFTKKDAPSLNIGYAPPGQHIDRMPVSLEYSKH